MLSQGVTLPCPSCFTSFPHCPVSLQALVQLEEEVQEAVDDAFYATRLLADVASTVPAVTNQPLIQPPADVSLSAVARLPTVDTIVAGLPVYASEDDNEAARAHLHNVVEEFK